MMRSGIVAMPHVPIDPPGIYGANRGPGAGRLGSAGEAAAEQVQAMRDVAEPRGLVADLALDDLKAPNLKVNFDPANMLLYDMGDPIRAVEILGPDIRSVHVKDARRPTTPGHWGEEVPLGQGEVDIRRFVEALKRAGYAGPLIVEREVGDQAARLRDVASGLALLRDCLAS